MKEPKKSQHGSWVPRAHASGISLALSKLQEAISASGSSGSPSLFFSPELLQLQRPRARMWAGQASLYPARHLTQKYGRVGKLVVTANLVLATLRRVAAASGQIPRWHLPEWILVYRCRITLEPRCDLSLRSARYTNAMKEPPWHTAAQAVCRLGWG